MKNENATPSEFELAAKEAAKELPTVQTATDVQEWINRHYRSAGYKHLCRELRAHQFAAPVAKGKAAKR